MWKLPRLPRLSKSSLIIKLPWSGALNSFQNPPRPPAPLNFLVSFRLSLHSGAEEFLRVHFFWKTLLGCLVWVARAKASLGWQSRSPEKKEIETDRRSTIRARNSSSTGGEELALLHAESTHTHALLPLFRCWFLGEKRKMKSESFSHNFLRSRHRGKGKVFPSKKPHTTQAPAPRRRRRKTLERAAAAVELK